MLSVSHYVTTKVTIGPRNKSWLYCRLTRAADSHCFESITFLTAYHTGDRVEQKHFKLFRYLYKLAKCKKIILSKQKVKKISTCVIAHQTMFHHKICYL